MLAVCPALAVPGGARRWRKHHGTWLRAARAVGGVAANGAAAAQAVFALSFHINGCAAAHGHQPTCWLSWLFLLPPAWPPLRSDGALCFAAPLPVATVQAARSGVLARHLAQAFGFTARQGRRMRV